MGFLHATRSRGRLEGVAFSFSESMSGRIDFGGMAAETSNRTHHDYSETIRLNVRIRTADLGRFLRDPQHRADMAGDVSVPSLGGTFPIRDGQFQLFSVNPQTGVRELVYSFQFCAEDGQPYFFRGHKNILHEPWRFDMFKHMTHLFSTVYRGTDGNAAVYGVGVLRFRLADAPSLVASMKCEGFSSHRLNLAARAAVLSVAWGVLRNEYLKGIRLFYESRYQNLVLGGVLESRCDGAGISFLLVSGTHDKDFPWGDGELYWDVLLAVADPGGGYRRYCITDRTLPGLELDVATGTYRYRGPMLAIDDGFRTSWSGMRSIADESASLRAEIDVEFESQPAGVVSFPFPGLHPLVRGISSVLIGWLWRELPGTNPPGIHIRPQAVVVRCGAIRILRASDGETIEDLRMNAADTGGECENGTFRHIKRPRLRYRYRCTVDPGLKTARVQIVAGTFGAERPGRRLLDRLVRRAGSAEIRIGAESGLQVTKITHPWQAFTPVLEVSNDQYPTAVFQRRIVEAADSGERLLALEEDVGRVRIPDAAGGFMRDKWD